MQANLNGPLRQIQSGRNRRRGQIIDVPQVHERARFLAQRLERLARRQSAHQPVDLLVTVARLADRFGELVPGQLAEQPQLPLAGQSKCLVACDLEHPAKWGVWGVTGTAAAPGADQRLLDRFFRVVGVPKHTSCLLQALPASV